MLDVKNFLFEGRFRFLSLWAFSLIGLLAAFDIIADLIEGTDLIHVILELFVLIIALFSAFAIFIRLIREARESRSLVSQLTRDLEKHQQQALAWKNENQNLLEGLGASINKQFEKWGLSPSEKETALFLLKGLSHKEVAALREVTEATARQQAGAIYKKAGLSGRHDLSAFFLEDLALPINTEQ